MDLNGVEYYYIRTTKGDIIGIFDRTGAQVASLCSSVNDSFSGKYSNNEAWARTAVDVANTVLVLAFFAGGGWALLLEVF